MIIYVGDSKNVIKRIQTHCSGNVEGSAFRKYVAKAKEYTIKITRRSGGSRRVRIDQPDPKMGEQAISDYMCSGTWRYIICDSSAEAKDFQWYAINQLKPLLNKECKPWSHRNVQRYQSLLDQLMHSPALNCEQLRSMKTGSGVYLFEHQRRP